jgi:threonine/homoserine/homoserine lactone efflux protein
MTALFLPLAAFVVAAGIFTITPGFDTALVLRTAATDGARSAAAAAAGICLGCLVWGVGAAFGLTALLAASELAFSALKWLGAAYLMYLGIWSLLWPRAGAAAPAMAPFTPAGGWHMDAFRRGLLTNLLNPKVGVFYITFLPQFIPPGVNVGLFSLALAAIHVALSLIWFNVLIALTVPLNRFLARPRVVRTLDRLTGCIFVGFGLKLALSDRV